jgi:hypothetical protein
LNKIALFSQSKLQPTDVDTFVDLLLRWSIKIKNIKLPNNWWNQQWCFAVKQTGKFIMVTIEISCPITAYASKTSKLSLLCFGDTNTDGSDAKVISGNQPVNYSMSNIMVFEQSLPNQVILSNLYAYGPECSSLIKCQLDNPLSNLELLNFEKLTIVDDFRMGDAVRSLVENLIGIHSSHKPNIVTGHRFGDHEVIFRVYASFVKGQIKANLKYLQLEKKSLKPDYTDRMDAARKLEWSMVILKDLKSYEPKIKKLSAPDSSSTVDKSLKAILAHSWNAVLVWGDEIKKKLEKAQETTPTEDLVVDDISNQVTCEMHNLYQLSNDLVDEENNDNNNVVMTAPFDDPLSRPLDENLNDENLDDETPARTASSPHSLFWSKISAAKSPPSAPVVARWSNDISWKMTTQMTYLIAENSGHHTQAAPWII